MRHRAALGAVWIATAVVGCLTFAGVATAAGPEPISDAPTDSTPGAAAADVADRPDSSVNGLAIQLGSLDLQVQQLEAAVARAGRDLAAAERTRDAQAKLATSREQLEARLVAQARAYAIQRYMYGSTDTTGLLALIASLRLPLDEAVWGLATLEVSSEDALDKADQVGKARAAIAERLAALETNVLQLRMARSRHDAELTAITTRRAQVAAAFAGATRDLGRSTVDGMTTVAFQAYRRAADTLAREQPACGLRWELLAAIGKTESNHGAGRLDLAGNTVTPILGIPIGADTDGGALDGDSARDHAVGPMQFIPSTWKRWGTDANGDRKADPGNIFDATTAAGRYLCRAAGAATLGTAPGVVRAILAYNPNLAYLRLVGARYQALVGDPGAVDWFGSATLPEPDPSAVAELSVTPNAPPQGRTPPGSLPAPPPPVATKVVQVQIFTASGLAAPFAGRLTERTGTGCLGPSLLLTGRTGFLRCQLAPPPRPAGPTGSPTAAPGTVLDPCQVAPYDASLVGCLADPTAPPVLLRLPTELAVALATAPVGAPPPYRLVVLDGGDRCLPLPGPPSTPTTAASNPTTSTPQTRPRRGGTSTTTPTATAAAGRAAPAAKAAATSTTTVSTGEAPTTRPPRSTTSTLAPTTSGPATTTSTTIAPTTTTIPLASRPTYACASGATVLGLPRSSASTWTVTVRQPGLADRVLPVATVYA